MKKYLSLFFLIFLILILCSCGESRGKDIIGDFSAEIAVDGNGMHIEGDMTNTRQGIMTLDVSTPDTVNSLSYLYKDGKVTMKFEDVETTADNDSFPKDCIAQRLFQSLVNCWDMDKVDFKGCEDGNALYEKKYGDDVFTIYVDKNSGFIKKIAGDGFLAELNDTKAFE